MSYTDLEDELTNLELDLIIKDLDLSVYLVRINEKRFGLDE